LTFECRAVDVAPGGERPYDEAEWGGALVVVTRGRIELESTHGLRLRFARGDMLWLAGLPLRALRNRGDEPALLVAITPLH
jgi:hypothetical protein